MSNNIITSHIVEGDTNQQLEILVTDKPGAGGASHRYEITGFDTATNASKEGPDGYSNSFSKQVILFQNGTIPENGANGVTQEALLAIVKDRLESFQSGPFANEYNKRALEHVNEALSMLKSRTLSRIIRGVEGKHEK